ncbi:hypothetical protein Lser_V15G24480 [Lactuca serriola]
MGKAIIDHLQHLSEELKGAVVYLDAGCIESFKFLGAFPVLLEMGVLSICSLESMSSLDMAIDWNQKNDDLTLQCVSQCTIYISILETGYDEARMKIYSVSTRCYYAFGVLVSEEFSYKIKELPGVHWDLPDSYLDVKNKDYGIDKVSLSTSTKIAIIDHEKKLTFLIQKDGLPDAGVWNPWDKKAKAMPDFEDDEYKHMLCVEAVAMEYPITLKLGEDWKGRQQVLVVPSSYCSGKA